MRIVSAFDGVSCLRVALKEADIHIESYMASEIDETAKSISKYHWPDITQIGDVKQVKSSDLGSVDFLAGGSPCTSFSFMGNMLNFESESGKLFYQFVRLLEELKPTYFLFENVNMKKEYMAIMTSYLGVEPIRINSSLLTAQMRDRWYWTNIQNVTVPTQQNITLSSILEEGAYTDREKSYCSLAYYDSGPATPKRIAHYKNYHVKQLVYDDSTKYGMRGLTPIEYERTQGLPDNYTKFGLKGDKIVDIPITHRYKTVGNGWSIPVITHILKHIQN